MRQPPRDSARLRYAPRFLRHYRHRRQAGYSVAHAVHSTWIRMRLPPT